MSAGRHIRGAPLLVAALATTALGTPALQADPTPPVSPGAVAGTLVVLAAASLIDAFHAIAAELTPRYPGLRIELSFAGSSTLARQVAEGARADVLATADEASIRTLAAAGHLAGGAEIFARNTLVIAVAPGNPKRVTTLRDLARPDVSVALCVPAVPAGRYTAEAFARAGIALPATSQELDVRAVLNKVALGEVDAGIVYATDVGAARERVDGIPLVEAADVIARYPIAALAGAPNPAAARAFIDFVRGPDGQAILRRFGFGAP
jgi:molybdate transport system substrate-binding protein